MMLCCFITVATDPVVKALGGHPKPTGDLTHRMIAFRNLLYRFNLEHFAVPLPTHKHLRYSYIVTLGGVYKTQGDSGSKLIVFSDDMDFSKEMLRKVDAELMFMRGVSTPVEVSKRTSEPQDQWDLFLMTFCQQHIIANSTYSWWGAFLSKSDAVYYPRRWWGPEIKATDSRGIDIRQSWVDAMPEDWNCVPC